VSIIKAYRITHHDYQDTAFSGEGARIHGGRWNEKGSAVVYLSSHPALAVLEVLVHLEDDEELNNFCMIEVDLPEEQIFILEDSYLPKDWNEYPAPSSTVNIGQVWLGSALGMRVPSVTLTYKSFNDVLDVSHPLFSDVLASATPVPLELDPRLAN
jgi:RES domain-containing protein